MKRTVIAFLLTLTMTVGIMQPVMAADTATTQKRPTSWDLTSIYADDAATQADLNLLKAYGQQINSYKGKLNNVDNIIKVYDLLNEADIIDNHIFVYTELLTSLDNSNNAASALLGQYDNAKAEYNIQIAYMNEEILANSDAFLDKVQNDSRMAANKTQFIRLRQSKTHILNEHDQSLIQPLNDLTKGAYNLYSKLTYAEKPVSSITFPDGVTRNADDNNFSLIFSTDYNQDFRLKYVQAYTEPYHNLRSTYAQNYSNYCKGTSEIAKAHGYSSALAYSLDQDDVDPALYQNLMKASIDTADVYQDYIQLVKDELNLDKIYGVDFNVPITAEPDKKYTYDEACDLILKALAPLGDQYVSDASKLLDAGIVDVYPADGKTTGAFAEVLYNESPYILTNFKGQYYDVSTLIHELGHAMNMLYSYNTQTTVYSSNPNALVSEVTSTMNEILLADYMIENSKSTDEKKYYISQELKLFNTTFYTQTRYAYFQENSMSAIENDETLTADKLGQLWIDSEKAYSGDTLSDIKYSADGWAHIPHFYYGFYVYNYAAAIAAAANIEERITDGEPNARDSYIAYISSGNTASVEDTLKIAGVDTSDTKFITAFTDKFESLMNEYKALG